MDAGSPASTAPIRCLNRQTPLMASSNFTKLAITAAWAAATFCSGGMAQPTAPGSAQPGNYRQLRPELFKALAACHQTAEVLACETASSALQTMLVVSQLPVQRQLRPRCLGSLTQLETHLSVFRWGLEPKERLQRISDQAMADCPAPPPISAPPAASN